MELSEIHNILREELSSLENEMANMSKTSVPLINELSEHIIQSGGKRLRPIILMLSSKLNTSQKAPHIIQAAVILEFIHAATLLHDDVVDMSEIRHSKDTANTIWGNKGAVLVGDFLYSRAFEMIVEIDNPMIYKILAHTTNTIAQGEVMQLMNIENTDITEQIYMEIIYRKTAILFEASAKIGGVLASYDENSIEFLGEFGRFFGIAYQLRNDYLDYFGDSELTGKNVAEDLVEGKITLPLIHSLSISKELEQSKIIDQILNPQLNNTGIIKDILQRNHSDDYVQKLISEYTSKALDKLDIFKSNDYSQALKDLTKLCESRLK